MIWKIENGKIISDAVDGCDGFVQGTIKTSKANESHIVKCVNCHDEFVSLLESVLSLVGNYDDEQDFGNISMELREKIKQALKKAGAI